jgi:GH15 family glucan-1,4-alpha-glucosidase
MHLPLSARGDRMAVTKAEFTEGDHDRPISDYAFLGDCHGSALVGKDGSIDWCCLERFDSDPVLSRLLDRRAGSFLQIGADGEARSRRRYLPATNVIETTIETAEGAVRVTDFMPVCSASQAKPGDFTELVAPHWLVRQVEGVSGAVPMIVHYRPRRGFEAEAPPIRLGCGRVEAEGCPHFTADVAFDIKGDVAVVRFMLPVGERRCFVIGADAPTGPALAPAVSRWLERTIAFWSEWSGCISYSGPYRDAVMRSCIVLKAMTYAPTGALAAAPTTSLPETIGGVRNWDYRFCWLRDACFALYAMKKLGLVDTTSAFFQFVQRIAGETRPRLLPLYGIGGEIELTEREIGHFAGYRRSHPVRTGNEAVEQHQLDVYGQLLDLMYSYERLGGALDSEMCAIGVELADYVAGHWREPDAGLWEPRVPERRYTHSAVMAWTAVDRAIRLFGERPAWCEARDALVQDILTNGVDGRHGYLTQAFGHSDLDAAVLIAPMVDFPIADAVLDRTVEAVIETLGHGPLVYRYRNDDGLPGQEGTFLVCAFWLVDALLALGRGEEARDRFETLLASANDVGLYAEQIGEDGTFLGNFPQAFTHLGLLQTALVLDLFDAYGVAGVRGTYADRALRSTDSRTLDPMTSMAREPVS